MSNARRIPAGTLTSYSSTQSIYYSMCSWSWKWWKNVRPTRTKQRLFKFPFSWGTRDVKQSLVLIWIWKGRLGICNFVFGKYPPNGFSLRFYKLIFTGAHFRVYIPMMSSFPAVPSPDDNRRILTEPMHYGNNRIQSQNSCIRLLCFHATYLLKYLYRYTWFRN